MKLAISGKGGVGKTTLAAVLARLFADEGQSVVAIDADLDSSLASALGVPNAEGLTPIGEMADLIAERTESGKKGYGKLFKLNPTVADIPDKFSIVHKGVRLMVLGASKRGGGGCNCPENVFLRTLLNHLAFQRDETLILDMEAGTEHLGRATCEAIDALIVVVEPGRRSAAIADHVQQMAKEIGVKRVFLVANKVRSPKDLETLRDVLPKGAPLLGSIGFDERLMTADLEGRPVDEVGGKLFDEVRAIRSELLRQLKR
ncbi:MAG TPA: P-loop NTPase [Planctomycetota bacterium]|nr:P-loop NTPase [Planctomycetota bacterium]